jgi:hypothetical protein
LTRKLFVKNGKTVYVQNFCKPFSQNSLKQSNKPFPPSSLSRTPLFFVAQTQNPPPPHLLPRANTQTPQVVEISPSKRSLGSRVEISPSKSFLSFEVFCSGYHSGLSMVTVVAVAWLAGGFVCMLWAFFFFIFFIFLCSWWLQWVTVWLRWRGVAVELERRPYMASGFC